jgi:hypothetical protein
MRRDNLAFRSTIENGKVVLGGFSSAIRSNTPQVHDAQPSVYRCPEVMLGTEWSSPVDIWNVGAMVRAVLRFSVRSLI